MKKALTKQEVKAAVCETLKKVEPATKLPAFVEALKMQTFFRVVIGEITSETADAILDTIKEFSGE